MVPRRVERENKRKRIELSQKLAARREKDDDAALSLKEETLLEAEERERKKREERGERRRQGEVPKEGGSETLSSILPLSPASLSRSYIHAGAEDSLLFPTAIPS